MKIKEMWIVTVDKDIRIVYVTVENWYISGDLAQIDVDTFNSLKSNSKFAL